MLSACFSSVDLNGRLYHAVLSSANMISVVSAVSFLAENSGSSMTPMLLWENNLAREFATSFLSVMTTLLFPFNTIVCAFEPVVNILMRRQISVEFVLLFNSVTNLVQLSFFDLFTIYLKCALAALYSVQY